MPAGSSTSSGPEGRAVAPTAERLSLTVDGIPVAGVLHRPGGPGPSACVVACHGMGASKDSDKYLLLAREFPACGLALARFDFRGSGESGGGYADATVASRVADLEAILDHLRRHPRLDGRFGFLGSSLGGFVALWAASRRGGPLPLVTWNSPASLLDLERADTGGPSGPGPALVAEVSAGRYAESPAGVGGVLIIQADRDEVVPPVHGRRLFDRAADPRALCVLAGADHRLTDPVHRMEAVERSLRWFRCHFGDARG